MKKILVLGILFILPITAYLFFSSGVNHFAKLPVLSQEINAVSYPNYTGGQSVNLEGKITILSFFGSDIPSKYGNVFNLTHKIYKPYHEFEDLQFVTLLEKGNEPLLDNLLIELNKLTDTSKWKFVFAEAEEIQSLFASLKTNLTLDENLSTSHAFIIDKDRNLRGRNDDKDIGMLYGYDTATVAVLNNKMKDDIKVILAEYRLALKKYNKRKI